MKTLTTKLRWLPLAWSLAGMAWADAGAGDWPQAKGPLFALRNGGLTTPVVAFDAKGRDLMAFSVATRGRAMLGRFEELVCDGGSFVARDAGTWTGMQLRKADGFSLEATLTPKDTPPSTGVIIAYANAQGEDVALCQDQAGLAWRVAGKPPVPLFAVDAGMPAHVVLACDKSKWTAYRNGKPAASGAMPAFPAWAEREVVLGAAWSESEPWRGRLEGVAIFPRALAADEAAKQAAAMRAIQAARQPATVVRFQGTLARQARTSTLEEIRPYTRSLSAAEYKVDKVLQGQWKHPTITVLHWMIMDAKRLPIADRKPGAKVELRVEPVAENPQLESNRRDELDNMDLDVELFYCESEDP